MCEDGNKHLPKMDRCLSEVTEALLKLSRQSLLSDTESERVKADSLFDLAKEADSLRRRITATMNGRSLSGTSEQVIRTQPESRSPRRERRARRKTSRAPRRDYPKFFRQGDSLVKVGWSRGKKSEYRHVVPREAYRKIVDYLVGLSRSTREFSAEDVVSASGDPSYQTYIVLALLRHSRLLEIPTRGKWAFSNPDSLAADMEAVWPRLAQERNEKVKGGFGDERRGVSNDE